jgi:hypothetical protein
MAVALILAVVSALPKYRPLEHVGPLPEWFNLLFFGHFSAVDFDRYADEMRRLIADDGSVMDAQLRDIHEMGRYLQHGKYRWLRYSYLVFMAGIVIGGATEAVALAL